MLGPPTALCRQVTLCPQPCLPFVPSAMGKLKRQERSHKRPSRHVRKGLPKPVPVSAAGLGAETVLSRNETVATDVKVMDESSEDEAPCTCQRMTDTVAEPASSVTPLHGAAASSGAAIEHAPQAAVAVPVGGVFDEESSFTLPGGRPVPSSPTAAGMVPGSQPFDSSVYQDEERMRDVRTRLQRRKQRGSMWRLPNGNFEWRPSPEPDRQESGAPDVRAAKRCCCNCDGITVVEGLLSHESLCMCISMFAPLPNIPLVTSPSCAFGLMLWHGGESGFSALSPEAVGPLCMSLHHVHSVDSIIVSLHCMLPVTAL